MVTLSGSCLEDGEKRLIEPRQEKTCFFCIRENKGNDQLHGYRATDQHLVLLHTIIDSTMPLLPNSEISSLFMLCGCTSRFQVV